MRKNIEFFSSIKGGTHIPAPQKFRSALNGFNREDVAGYLEYINSKHITQVNQLTAEADSLRSQLNDMESSCDQAETVAALEQERDELRAEVEALRARCAELEASLQSAPCNPAPVAAPAALSPADELEIYRRAERTERMARDRADMIYRQTNGILKEASFRISDASETILPAAEQAMTQLTQLLNTINSGKQSLQDAVVILNTLRSDN